MWTAAFTLVALATTVPGLTGDPVPVTINAQGADIEVTCSARDSADVTTTGTGSEATAVAKNGGVDIQLKDATGGKLTVALPQSVTLTVKDADKRLKITGCKGKIDVIGKNSDLVIDTPEAEVKVVYGRDKGLKPTAKVKGVNIHMTMPDFMPAAFTASGIHMTMPDVEVPEGKDMKTIQHEYPEGGKPITITAAQRFTLIRN